MTLEQIYDAVFLKGVEMPRCCICKLWIWPWNRKSAISADPTHRECHEKLLEDATKKHPFLQSMFASEIHAFEQKMGVVDALRIPSRNLMSAAESMDTAM